MSDETIPALETTSAIIVTKVEWSTSRSKEMPGEFLLKLNGQAYLFNGQILDAVQRAIGKFRFQKVLENHTEGERNG